MKIPVPGFQASARGRVWITKPGHCSAVTPFRLAPRTRKSQRLPQGRRVHAHSRRQQGAQPRRERHMLGGHSNG